MAMSIGNPQFSAEEQGRRHDIQPQYVEAMMDVVGTSKGSGPCYVIASEARGPRYSYSNMTEERRTKRVIRRQRRQ